MSENNFKTRQQTAIEQMREMSRRSRSNEPAATPTPIPEKTSAPKKNTSAFGGLGLPFLDNLKTDSDLTLILGILLLLLSEKADKRLLFALIYILL